MGVLYKKSDIKYYDFLVGIPNSHPRDWKYQPLKLAAFSPEMAIYAKLLLNTGVMIKRVRRFELKGDNASLLALARMSIRKIIEFDLTDMKGKTQYRFKKIEEYRLSEELKIV